MFTLLAAVLAGPFAPVPPGIVVDPVVAEVQANRSIRINLNGGDYSPGDEVRVQVEPGDDGYLVVFRVDGDGRVRVLFPIDPDIDAYVRGGRRYEIRGRGERTTFLADDIGGTGLIYAALSRSPMAFGDYSVNARWDYGMLRLRNDIDDPEDDLTAIVRRMTGNVRFDYDVVGYRIHGARSYAGAGGYGSGMGYDPYYDCLACGYSVGRGVSIRIGSRYGYDPYDPWWYGDAGYGYRRYGYGYGYNYGYPYGYGGWGDPYRPIVVYPTRPRQVTPSSPYGYRARPQQPLSGIPTSFAPDLDRGVRPAPRPVPEQSYDGRSRVRNTTAEASRPAAERPQERNDPRRETPAPREPQRQPEPSARPAPAPAPTGNSGRSRRPTGNIDDAPAVEQQPSVDRQPLGAPTLIPDGRPIFRESPQLPRGEPTTRGETQPASERPVYREPARAEPARGERSRPTAEPQPRREAPAREAPRAERPAPRAEPQPRRESPPPQREAPRTERPAPQPSTSRAPSPAPSPAPEPSSRSRKPNN